MLRAGTVSVQALARRLRLFAFEVFFLGTAMIKGALSVFSRNGATGPERGGSPTADRTF
jgi:hypothetical protein